MKRYNVAGLKAIYGAPADTPALLELKRWRGYADALISAAHVAQGLELIGLVSELTASYRRSRLLNLDEADRRRLADVLAPPMPVPQAAVMVQGE